MDSYRLYDMRLRQIMGKTETFNEGKDFGLICFENFTSITRREGDNTE